jgi:hypothetical protein
MSRSDEIFDDDKLWEELNGSDSERRSAAIRALDALGTLAMLRTITFGLRYDEVWKHIYEASLLHRDTRRGDGDVLCDAAAEVGELSQLIELREYAQNPTTEADRKWARAVAIRMRARLAELRRGLAAQLEAANG